MSTPKPLSQDELACVYSALILADDDVPVTAEKINTLLEAAGVTVEKIWPELFAKALQGVNIRELITTSVCGFTSGVTSGISPAKGAAPEEETEVKDAPAPVQDDDSDEDFGFGLFD